jgi:beta-galactosidase
MKRTAANVSLLILSALLVIIAGCRPGNRSDLSERDRLFNTGWKFMQDSLPAGPEQSGFDDSEWLSLDLPHDWSIRQLPGPESRIRSGRSPKAVGATSELVRVAPAQPQTFQTEHKGCR